MAETLEQLVRNILNTVEFSGAPQRSALFAYLWEHRSEPVEAEAIWKALNQQKKAKQKREEPYDNDRIRTACRELRRALVRYFNSAKSNWRISLPPAQRGEGYQLRVVETNELKSTTAAFWHGHICHSRKVFIVYAEQLFYEDWPNHHVFRRYDLNAANESHALAELQLKYPQDYKPEIVASYSYLTCGDVEARDLIATWFNEEAFVATNKAITRRMDDQSVAAGSLILLRSASINSMVRDILREHTAKHLELSLDGEIKVDDRLFNRAIIKGATDEELERCAPFKPIPIGNKTYALNYSPDQGSLLGLVTRVRSPYVNAAVTIFDSEYGRAVEQLARLFTDEERLRPFMEEGLKWKPPFPESFEILFSIPVKLSTDHRPVKLDPLAWRRHSSKSSSPTRSS